MSPRPASADPLETLATGLRAEGSILSAHVRETIGAEPVLGRLVAQGPRAAAHPDAYAEVVEAVREGYLLHYETSRLIEAEDPNLRLLAGDYLYALGLDRLAGLEDLAAVAELSDLIAISAQIHAGGEDPGPLSPALWIAGVTAVGWGQSREHEAAKAVARDGLPGAAEAFLDAARIGLGSPDRPGLADEAFAALRR